MSWKRDQFGALISQCTRSRFVFWFMELPECCCSQTEAALLNLLCFSGSLWVFQDPWFCLGSMLPFIPSECCRNPDPWHPECNRGTTQAIPREPFPIKWELQLWAKLTSPIKFHFRASSWLLQCLQPWNSLFQPTKLSPNHSKELQEMLLRNHTEYFEQFDLQHCSCPWDEREQFQAM